MQFSLNFANIFLSQGSKIVTLSTFLTNKVGSQPLKVIKSNNIITITNEQGSINIPIEEIQSFESRICSSNISLTNFSYWIIVSHELKIITNSGILSFIYPTPWYSYFKTNYDEVFQLIDMNIPNYKCTLIGDINHINKDIEYYIEHKKRLPFKTRSYLFFLDLPLPMKFLYLLMLSILTLSVAFYMFILVSIR